MMGKWLLKFAHTPQGAKLIGRARTQGVKGVYNAGNDLRIGVGWKGTGQAGHVVFRISGKRVTGAGIKSGHIDFEP